MNEGLFRTLAQDEETEFRQWARNNYKPFEPIQGIWHPALQSECVKMNAEAGASLDLAGIAKALLEA